MDVRRVTCAAKHLGEGPFPDEIRGRAEQDLNTLRLLIPYSGSYASFAASEVEMATDEVGSIRPTR